MTPTEKQQHVTAHGIENAAGWMHCRWIEPHPADPDPETIGPVRAMGGRIGAACRTCGEALTVPAPYREAQR